MPCCPFLFWLHRLQLSEKNAVMWRNAPAGSNSWALNCWFEAWQDVCACSDGRIVVAGTLHSVPSPHRWRRGSREEPQCTGLHGSSGWLVGLPVPCVLLCLLSAGQSLQTCSVVLPVEGVKGGLGYCFGGVHPRNAHIVPCQSPYPTVRLCEVFPRGSQNSTWLEA